ncbi:ROK family protein [Micromonospora sp. NPDC048898]|uniref:ROK family protein n=1 Tax=Micromonospora sp. NPDC048898 TaxID=3364260 RepID=UPI00371C9E2A
MAGWNDSDGATVVVADIGGTTLRIGRWDAATGRLHDVTRHAVDGLARYPQEPPERLQSRVLAQLGDRLADYLSTCPEARTVGLAFAGPVDDRGTVLAAPTIWGGGGEPLDLGEILTRRLGRSVVVANDMTAAAWRYAAEETEGFCVVTISSGIGNKVFRDGRVLVHPQGYGGELGHWLVDPRPDALPCDCGGRGHLGAVASGRGLLAAARRAAVEHPDRFAGSALARPSADPEAMTCEALAEAVRAGDTFATDVLCESLRYLALAISCVYTAIGIRRYVVIGGFAVAVGEPIIEHLTGQLRAVGCFGLGAEEIGQMVRLGATDDDHCLIGMGHLASRDTAGVQLSVVGER